MYSSRYLFSALRVAYSSCTWEMFSSVSESCFRRMFAWIFNWSSFSGAVESSDGRAGSAEGSDIVKCVWERGRLEEDLAASSQSHVTTDGGFNTPSYLTTLAISIPVIFMPPNNLAWSSHGSKNVSAFSLLLAPLRRRQYSCGLRAGLPVAMRGRLNQARGGVRIILLGLPRHNSSRADLSQVGPSPPPTVSATPRPKSPRVKADLVAEFRDLKPSYLAPKYPVVLCHGLFGFDSLDFRIPHIPGLGPDDDSVKPLAAGAEVKHPAPYSSIRYWRGIQESLEANKVKVYTAAVAPTATIEIRAKYLERAILLQIVKPWQRQQKLKEEKDREDTIHINLIGHSMGGLDARYYISQLLPRYNELAEASTLPKLPSDIDTFTKNLVKALDLGGSRWEIPIPKIKVHSLTTVSTPHRGSYFADNLMDSLLSPEKIPGLYKLLPSLGFDYTLTKEHKLIQETSDETTGAFYQLTRKYLSTEFNPRIRDDPSVSYFSYGSAYWPKWWHMNLFFGPAQRMIYKEEGPNDGLVSVESAKWGEYQGTVQNVNHVDLINVSDCVSRSLSPLLTVFFFSGQTRLIWRGRIF